MGALEFSFLFEHAFVFVLALLLEDYGLDLLYFLLFAVFWLFDGEHFLTRDLRN